MRFVIFFATFSLLYGGLHLYAFLKARRGLNLGSKSSMGLAGFMLVMIFSPVIVRVSERMGLDLFPLVLAHVGYIWMGVLFLFISSAFLLDLYRLLVYLSGRLLRRDLSRIRPTPRQAFVITLSLCLAVSIYGHFEALGIVTEHVVIRTPKIPEKVGRIRIVQISDVHLGLVVRGWRLERILDRVRAAEPDILVSTGDLVDGQIDHMAPLAEKIGAIKTRYGKFAVTGNHEFYAGLERATDFTSAAGFILLRGRAVRVAGMINIAGIDDPEVSRRGRSLEGSERAILSGLPKDRFTLLLKHRPLVSGEAAGLFDLQLSGHTHRGQIFPFTLIIKALYPVDSGLVRFEDGSRLYVSRGTGTWGPPMRFLSPPEVTVIDLVHGS